jgi:uncharacterized protein with GYD domain
MPKFLVRGSYSPEGAKGLLKEGASGRKEAVEKMVSGAHGKIEAFYYSFGEDDVVLIIDLPDNKAAASISLAVNSTGMVSIKSTPLMTMAEIDEACKATVNYRAPKP